MLFRSAVYFIFKRFEPVYIHQHFWLLVAPPALLALTVLADHHAPLRAAALAYTAHWATVAGATLLYRASPWHPLARHPGPCRYRLSKVALAWATRDGSQYRHVAALHDRYGDIVRIGASAFARSGCFLMRAHATCHARASPALVVLG